MCESLMHLSSLERSLSLLAALAFQFRSFRQPLQLTEARLFEASFQVGLLTSQSKTLQGGNARKTIGKP